MEIMMSKKRELLLNTALDLFYRQGINSIGINEVIKVSGVAKKTLYNRYTVGLVEMKLN